MWWSDDEWSGLTSEDTCGMCADADLQTNDHSMLIATTDTSYVRLARNQTHAGYCLVILREHVTDMAALPAAQLAEFWADVQCTARSIQKVHAPKKIDYLVMGHQMPHLHCHLLPQHREDDPHHNPNIADGPTHLTDADLRDATAALAQAWAALRVAQ